MFRLEVTLMYKYDNIVNPSTNLGFRCFEQCLVSNIFVDYAGHNMHNFCSNYIYFAIFKPGYAKSSVRQKQWLQIS